MIILLAQHEHMRKRRHGRTGLHGGQIHPGNFRVTRAALQEEVCRRLEQLEEQRESRGRPEECKLEADPIKGWARLYADEGGGLVDWL